MMMSPPSGGALSPTPAADPVVQGDGVQELLPFLRLLVPVIPDLVQIGVDILDPIQVSAAGMKPEELFRLFGDRLSFHGAIDEAGLLTHATPGVSRDDASHRHLGPGGGYIVAPPTRCRAHAGGKHRGHVPGGAQLPVDGQSKTFIEH